MEKLLDFARAAEREPELLRQLPRFVSEVRRIFEADEIRFQLARVERERRHESLCRTMRKSSTTTRYFLRITRFLQRVHGASC